MTWLENTTPLTEHVYELIAGHNFLIIAKLGRCAAHYTLTP